MRARAFLAGLVSCFTIAYSGLADTPPHPSILHVMLQGTSADELEQLVTDNGGRLTHHLPIINAVGAELSQEQLDAILESGWVGRYIDDLLVSDQPPVGDSPGNKGCDVGGALEIEITPAGFSWPLYNKKAKPARLTALELGWPESRGTIDRITLAGKTVPRQLFSDASGGHLQISLPEKPELTLAGDGDLVVQFRGDAEQSTLQGLQQNMFQVLASFAGGCETKLVPGYPDNHENFHYSNVAGAAQLHKLGVTGAGVTVAVLDSGLWETDELARNTRGQERILARFNAIKNRIDDELFDESGHGTHMTSVIAHSGAITAVGRPTGAFQGIAPDTNLVAIKAFNVEGQGGMLDIVRGVQWAVEHRDEFNIRVLNLSFAARPRWPYWLDPINQAIMRAWAAGIVVIAAAGNEGPEPMTIGSPGNLPYIITVGAVTDSWTPETRDDDYIPDFSSRGPTPEAHIKPDIVAPGGHITGITRPGSSLTQEHPEYMLRTGEFVMTGSSQAAALVSGIAALLLQLEPELTADDIKCKLITSAEPAINRDGLLAYTPFQQGHGYVSATRAITLGDRGCGNSDLDLARDLSGEEHFQGPATVDDNGGVSLPGLEQLLSAETPARGFSDTRKWGVKEHLEREGPLAPTTPDHPFDWPRKYLEEREKIQKLADQPPG